MEGKEDGHVSICSTPKNSNSIVKSEPQSQRKGSTVNNMYQSKKDHPLTKEGSPTLSLDSNQGTCGSLRKEREWKRTLACKLYDERHSVDGDEGMDLLWETYEKKSIKFNPKNAKKTKNQNQNQKHDEDSEEMFGHGHFCCFNGGKMNFGIGVISRAIQGFGWLGDLRKNSKKVHNNGSNRYNYTCD